MMHCYPQAEKRFLTYVLFAADGNYALHLPTTRHISVQLLVTCRDRLASPLATPSSPAHHENRSTLSLGPCFLAALYLPTLI
jgi:hypothetical protein